MHNSCFIDYWRQPSTCFCKDSYIFAFYIVQFSILFVKLYFSLLTEHPISIHHPFPNAPHSLINQPNPTPFTSNMQQSNNHPESSHNPLFYKRKSELLINHHLLISYAYIKFDFITYTNNRKLLRTC